MLHMPIRSNKHLTQHNTRSTAQNNSWPILNLTLTLTRHQTHSLSPSQTPTTKPLQQIIMRLVSSLSYTYALQSPDSPAQYAVVDHSLRWIALDSSNAPVFQNPACWAMR